MTTTAREPWVRVRNSANVPCRICGDIHEFFTLECVPVAFPFCWRLCGLVEPAQEHDPPVSRMPVLYHAAGCRFRRAPALPLRSALLFAPPQMSVSCWLVGLSVSWLRRCRRPRLSMSPHPLANRHRGGAS